MKSQLLSACSEIFFLKYVTHKCPLTLPNQKLLELTKFKAFADNNLNVTKMKALVFDGVEIEVGKGEKAGLITSIFSFSLIIFKAFFKSLKPGIMWQRVKLLTLSQSIPDFYVSAVQVF